MGLPNVGPIFCFTASPCFAAREKARASLHTIVNASPGLVSRFPIDQFTVAEYSGVTLIACENCATASSSEIGSIPTTKP
jgi:hypothetical protein